MLQRKKPSAEIDLERVSELEMHLEGALSSLHNSVPGSPEQTALVTTIRRYQTEYRTLTGKPYSPPERADED